MRNPSVSIVMCTYNGAKYLREQLDSILAQTRPADEIIVQDDGSVDDTLHILREYACRYPTLHVFSNEQEHGINANFFSALARATGDYIAISDQDDIWEPDKIERQLATIGDSLLCAGMTVPFSSDGVPTRIDPRLPNFSLLRTLYVGTLAGHTMLFPRRLLELMPDTRDFAEYRCYDAILTITAAAYGEGSIKFVPRTLVRQRRHAGAATYTPPSDNHMTMANILRSVLRTLRLYRELRPEIRRRLAHALAFLDEIDSPPPILQEARQMLRLQISRSPLDFFRLQCFCIRHQDELFHVRQPRGLLLCLRAAYFPVSCSEYFRFLSKSYHEKDDLTP